MRRETDDAAALLPETPEPGGPAAEPMRRETDDAAAPPPETVEPGGPAAEPMRQETDDAAALLPETDGPAAEPMRQETDAVAASPPETAETDGSLADPMLRETDDAAAPPPETEPAQSPPRPARGRRYEAFLVRAGEELVAWLKTFASAAVYATLIVTFGFQVARVEGKSMEPTLHDQDRLIVNKAIYKFFGDPRPGDIVMHYFPGDPDKSFVKRIIAEAGDTVRIEDGKVYVNEVPFPDAIPPEFRSREDYGPEVVQDAYYFVMGDHRNNSSDSRTWGQVPKKYIVGKVQLRWWPLTAATLF